MEKIGNCVQMIQNPNKQLSFLNIGVINVDVLNIGGHYDINYSRRGSKEQRKIY